MPLAWLGAVTLLLFAAAYLVYGRLLARGLGLDDDRPVPARVLEDGTDFIPTPPFRLLAQHFSAISAAGPIVGPILAGLLFGWGPGLLWILLGCVLIGAVHDMASLAASMRHGARSVAEILREHVGTPGYLLFLTFIWLALLLVVINFTDVTARAFMRGQLDIGGAAVVPGPGVASSSMMYLILAALMGVFLTKLKAPFAIVGTAGTALLFAIIHFGSVLPMRMPASLSQEAALRAWDAVILLYCFAASVMPMWLFLQPRGFLGGILLYVFLGTGLVGLFFGGFHAQAAPFVGWHAANGQPLVPILFVTIACGACSGFHGLVCSGTTSKQVTRESHARPVAYGAMLMEGVIAVIALATVMMVAPGAAPRGVDGAVDPNAIFAEGIARFASVLGVPLAFGLQFGFLALATFIYDTLDVCTRLGRYLLQELSLEVFGYKLDRFTATALTLAIPAICLLFGVDYLTAWRIFGASNQLLAALTLLALSVWLRRRGRNPIYIVLPMIFVMVMTVWALVLGMLNPSNPVVLRTLSGVLVALALCVIALSLRPFLRPRPLGREEHVTGVADAAPF
jgi:carbon starvation protein